MKITNYFDLLDSNGKINCDSIPLQLVHDLQYTQSDVKLADEEIFNNIPPEPEIEPKGYARIHWTDLESQSNNDRSNVYIREDGVWRHATDFTHNNLYGMKTSSAVIKPRSSPKPSRQKSSAWKKAWQKAKNKSLEKSNNGKRGIERYIFETLKDMNDRKYEKTLAYHCNSCETWKPVSEYTESSYVPNKKGHVGGMCKDCSYIFGSARRREINVSGSFLKKAIESQNNHRSKSKDRKGGRGIEVKLRRSDYCTELAEKCAENFYFHPFSYWEEGMSHKMKNPELKMYAHRDRIRSSGIYEKDNLRLQLGIVNKMKSDAETPEELKWTAYAAMKLVDDVCQQFGLTREQLEIEGEKLHFNYYREGQLIPDILDMTGVSEVYENDGEEIPSVVMDLIIIWEEQLFKKNKLKEAA